METLKEFIIDKLNNYSETTFEKGSCGELGEEIFTISSYEFEKIADDICHYLSKNLNK